MYWEIGQPRKTNSAAMHKSATYPGTLPQAVQSELVCDLCGVHCVWQILLVGKDQEESVAELVLVQHALQLLASLDDTITIVAVDDEDDTLSVLEVMPPQRSDLVLSTDIPHGELNVLVFDRLDVETCVSLLSAIDANRYTAAFRYAPMVGIVVTISPSLSLYKMVVFPAASNPTIKILISFLPQRRSNSFENVRPILAGCGVCFGRGESGCTCVRAIDQYCELFESVG